MFRIRTVLLACILLGSTISCYSTLSEARSRPAQTVIAEALSPLEPLGYAGLYVGQTGGVILAAGGTNFPGEPVWKNGKKAWYDHISILDGDTWRAVGRLPRPMAMGAAITTPRGVLIVGGGDEKEVFDDVFLLRYAGGQIIREDWPAFPKKIMASAAALIGSRVYVVAGHSDLSPMTNGPMAEMWSTNLDDPTHSWRPEPPIPAEPRWLPVVGTDGQSLFVMSGFSRKTDRVEKPAIHCLSDVWKFTPDANGGQWQRLADLPRANAGAPTPAPYHGGELFLLGGGVDDSNFGVPMDKRPPFPATITAVDVETGKSRVIGQVRSSVVAAGTAPWKGGCAVVSGEVRAGVRTIENWVYRFR